MKNALIFRPSRDVQPSDDLRAHIDLERRNMWNKLPGDTTDINCDIVGISISEWRKQEFDGKKLVLQFWYYAISVANPWIKYEGKERLDLIRDIAW